MSSAVHLSRGEEDLKVETPPISVVLATIAYDPDCLRGSSRLDDAVAHGRAADATLVRLDSLFPRRREARARFFGRVAARLLLRSSLLSGLSSLGHLHSSRPGASRPF